MVWGSEVIEMSMICDGPGQGSHKAGGAELWSGGQEPLSLTHNTSHLTDNRCHGRALLPHVWRVITSGARAQWGDEEGIHWGSDSSWDTTPPVRREAHIRRSVVNCGHVVPNGRLSNQGATPTITDAFLAWCQLPVLVYFCMFMQVFVPNSTR